MTQSEMLINLYLMIMIRVSFDNASCLDWTNFNKIGWTGVGGLVMTKSESRERLFYVVVLGYHFMLNAFAYARVGVRMRTVNDNPDVPFHRTSI